MKINSFGNDFVIQNNDIEKLSNQKKKGAGYPNLDQVPFSVGVGPSNRSRGVPYFCTQGNPTSYFTESRQTTAPTNPLFIITLKEVLKMRLSLEVLRLAWLLIKLPYLK